VRGPHTSARFCAGIVSVCFGTRFRTISHDIPRPRSRTHKQHRVAERVSHVSKVYGTSGMRMRARTREASRGTRPHTSSVVCHESRTRSQCAVHNHPRMEAACPTGSALRALLDVFDATWLGLEAATRVAAGRGSRSCDSPLKQIPVHHPKGGRGWRVRDGGWSSVGDL